MNAAEKREKRDMFWPRARTQNNGVAVVGLGLSVSVCGSF